MLYSCKNNIDSDEIKKMVPYFWKKFYFDLLFRSTILIFLISIIISIGCQNMIEGILFFVIVFVFCAGAVFFSTVFSCFEGIGTGGKDMADAALLIHIKHKIDNNNFELILFNF